MRPLLIWLSVLVLPVAGSAWVASVYVHEFSHGVAALAVGGHFLGIKGTLGNRHYSTLAYADVWSDRHDWLIDIAGILVTVLLGSLLLRQAYRARGLMGRLVLFLASGAFLADLDYAYEGCLLWETSEFDTASLLSKTGSPSLRGFLLAVLLFAVSAKAWILSTGLFRAWEDVFGGLTGKRALWVILLLVGPTPLPSFRETGAGWSVLSSAAIYVAVTGLLIRRRRRVVPPAFTGRLSPWGTGAWTAALTSAIALILLQNGIRLGTFRDRLILDVDGQERTIAGLTADFGMGDQSGRNRQVFGPRLFVSTPETVHAVPSPVDVVVDLAWSPASQGLLVVSPQSLIRIDLSSGDQETLWSTSRGRVTTARHGPSGEILVVFKEWSIEGRSTHSLQSQSSIFVYDPRRCEGRLHPAGDAVGNPVFAPGSPVTAWITVGNDLWRFTWPEAVEEELLLDRLEGESSNGWLEGVSRDKRWWADQDGWWSGETRVSGRRVTDWGIGTRGLYTLQERNQWELTLPEGGRAAGGSIDTRSVALLQVRNGTPWVVFRNGDVRLLTHEKAAFRAMLPP